MRKNWFLIQNTGALDMTEDRLINRMQEYNAKSIRLILIYKLYNHLRSIFTTILPRRLKCPMNWAQRISASVLHTTQTLNFTDTWEASCIRGLEGEASRLSLSAWLCLREKALTKKPARCQYSLPSLILRKRPWEQWKWQQYGGSGSSKRILQ
jgi:hypothetical protein